MSAIIDEAGENGTYEPIRVLISLHEHVDGMDVMGPLEVFALAQHIKGDKGKHSEEARRERLLTFDQRARPSAPCSVVQASSSRLRMELNFAAI